ncbi:MAG: response regulator [Candidatus Coprovivens sp.]
MAIETIKVISSTVSTICLIFIILQAITYFPKEKAKNSETRIYNYIVAINIFSLIAELLFYKFLNTNKETIILELVEKIYYISNVIWMYLLTIYNFAIIKSYSKNKIYEWSYNKKKIGIITTMIFIALLLIIMPITRIYDNGKIIGSSGAAPTIMFIICILLLIVDIIIITIYSKKIERKKKLPLVVFIIILLAELILTSIGIQLLLITFPMTVVTYLMYNTIENPDVKMLEEVSIAKEAAEKANSAKSDFLSNMSHEIRTPLNAIVGFSESLKEDNLSEESKSKVDDIIIASNNLLEIVNGILDISKIEANKLEIINKEYDVHSMLDELVSLTKARIGYKPLEFKVNIDQSIPSILYGDNTRLKQIILNLLTNAVKYTKEGFVEFTVSTVIKDNVCRLIVSVEDSGIGIKEESLSKLFTKFERLNVEKQLTIEGTGLGLAITKKLVDLMNGKIIVQSVYGKGSKFTVSIDQRIISVEKPLTKQEAKSESKHIDANGARILLVDDNELNIKVASTLLKKYNFNIDSCLSALSCISKINNGETYDIIFMDDMMPKMTGKEAVRKLKSNPDFKTPVIVLTANAITGMKEEYLKAGFDDYLAKPIEKKELERVIKEYINKTNNTNINSSLSKATNSILEKEIDLDKTILLKTINNEDYSNKKILLVDDNELNIKVALTTLKKYNIDITTANSGSECIEKVIENNYDLILLDDMMPELDGCTTLDNLKTLDGFVTPVVMMTASSKDEVQEKIDEHGFDGYLSKPINKEHLEELLNTLLNK